MVITEYRKIYKVMSDNTWTTPEVFNNVHPQLGGLHTVMSSSGSVGNLWWCRQMLSGKTFRRDASKLWVGCYTYSQKDSLHSDWPLYLWAVSEMVPNLFASAHVN